MTALEIVKNKIKNLYETNPNIRINVTLSHPKIIFRNDPVTIKAVYPHIFIIEEYTSGKAKTHTLQYTDILTKQIEIIDK